MLLSSNEKGMLDQSSSVSSYLLSTSNQSTVSDRQWQSIFMFSSQWIGRKLLWNRDGRPWFPILILSKFSYKFEINWMEHFFRRWRYSRLIIYVKIFIPCSIYAKTVGKKFLTSPFLSWFSRDPEAKRECFDISKLKTRYITTRYNQFNRSFKFLNLFSIITKLKNLT